MLSPWRTASAARCCSLLICGGADGSSDAKSGEEPSAMAAAAPSAAVGASTLFTTLSPFGRACSATHRKMESPYESALALPMPLTSSSCSRLVGRLFAIVASTWFDAT